MNKGFDDLSQALDHLHYLVENYTQDHPDRINRDKKQSLINIKKYKNDLYEMKRNPMSDESQERYRQLKTKLSNLKDSVRRSGRIYYVKARDEILDTFDDIEKATNKLTSTFSDAAKSNKN